MVRASRMSWRWHGILMLLLGAETVVAWSRHQDDAELERQRAEGSSVEKAQALFVLTNRGDPLPIDRELARMTVRSGIGMLQEWAMTPNFIRTGETKFQEEFVAQFREGPRRLRYEFFLHHGVVRGRQSEWLEMEDLRDFMASLAEADRSRVDGRGR